MDDTQPIYPRTLRQRLFTWLHREPVSHIAHWDQKWAQELPTFDVEAEWAFIVERINRLEDSIDDAHGDIADRLVEARVEAFRHRLKRFQLMREETLARLESQGKAKVVTLGQKVRDLRSDLRTATAEHIRAYSEVHGSDPAAVTAGLPIQARALPATPADTDPGTAPEPTIPPVASLHAVPTKPAGQPDHPDSTGDLDHEAWA